MSAYLGPIHHWLYKKVTLFERLEQQILEGLIAEVGEEARELYDNACKNHGNPLNPDVPLENQIDTDNIHGWLQTQIQKAETRQAEFLNQAFQKYNEEAVEIAREFYAKQGKFCGEESESHAKPQNAQDLYQEINNYVLDGMPCDQVNQLVVNEEDLVKWEVTQCLHVGYWKEVGADPNKFYKLRETWIDAFVAYANNDYEYRFSNDDGRLLHLIQKVND